jgi:hypothetical protein
VHPPSWLRWARAIPIVCIAAPLVVACADTVNGNKPVGKTVDSDAQLQRFLRRAYLDLSGHAPSDSELADGTARLRDAGNTASARGELVGDLIARDAFTAVWVSEFENAIFGGNSLEQQYTLVCSLIRGTTPACMSCTQMDSCACACPQLQALATERTQLRTAAADLHTGTPSATIERRYAMATGYFALAGAPETRVKALFDDFLARSPEADEVENGRAMVIGSLLPSPAGLLFHRLGANYSDLIDIVFHSEVYRDAIVQRVFDRYLARSPSAVELAHFVTPLNASNATDPDARDVVRAVVSSREYFAQ